MKIETKYDIGQEVWISDWNICDFNDRYANQKRIEYIDVHIGEYTRTIKYVFSEFGGGYNEENLYHTREACEQAIKEIEG